MEVVNYEERYPTVVKAQNPPHQNKFVENFEERYPTVVDAQNTPHHFPTPVKEDSPKYLADFPVDQKKPLTPNKDAYPEVVHASDPYAKSIDPAYPDAVPPKEEIHHEAVAGAAAADKRYCGLNKKAFLLVIGIVLLIIVGVVGGVIGGVMGKKHKKVTKHVSSSSDGSSVTSGVLSSVLGTATPTTTSGPGGSISTAATRTSTSTASPINSATSLDTSKAIGALAVSTFQDTDAKVYVHLYYQQGSNIAYRIYTGSGSFKAAQPLPFTTAPKAQTPIATVETASSGSTFISLFYLDSSNNIILANYTSAVGGASLTLTKTTKIVASTNVHASSQLAAVYLGIQYGYRLYFQAPKGGLQEYVGVRETWSSGAVLSANAIAGSPISISVAEIPKMNIFYVDATAKTLFEVHYVGPWSTGAALSSTALTAWNGTSTALAAIAQTNTMYLRTYYIGSDKGIYEMLDPGAGTSWSKDSDQSAKWPNADFDVPGSLVGIGWDNQVRIYYVSGGNIEQLALTGTAWGVSNNIGS